MVNLVGLSSRDFQNIYTLAFWDVLLGAPWGPLAQSLSLPWHVPCLEAPLAKAPPDLAYGVSRRRETAWVKPAG